MKSVALYGFASISRDGIWQSTADEVWSIAWAYNYHIPRLDMILEIHPIWMQARSQKPEFEKVRHHWEWLKTNHTIPVYMTEVRPEVPRSLRYPLEEVQALLPAARRRSVFTSSFDFLMGLAILKGYDRIEAYGFEMGSDTEYRYQREGAAYWISQCDARGIELVLPNRTALLKKRIYMVEGGAMIYRQDLERLLNQRANQKKDAFARLANLEGQMKQATDEDVRAAIAREWDKQYRIAMVTHGAYSEIEYLLKEIDLDEPSDELTDPYGVIEQ